MSIIVGDSTDGGRTGLAGRIANDIVAAFAGVTYGSGTNHHKGINAFVQGIVDALNNDKVDPVTQLGTNPMLGANTAAGQTIGNASYTAVVFGTVELDTDSAYNSGTGVFTVPTGKGGHYLIVGGIAYALAIAGSAGGSIFKGGVQQKEMWFVTPGGNQVLVVTAILNLAAGDAIDVRAYQNSGAGKALVGFGANNYIAIKRIS